jgi:hypothetical protein
MRPLVATLLAVASTGCSERLRTEDGVTGEAVAALAGACCITDVQTDALTYHFDSPRFVLSAAEGIGPRVLALTVAGFVGPLVSTHVAEHPTKAEISAAVGYDLGELYYLQASAALTVDPNGSKRLESFINYARSLWVVRDAACGAVLGTGMSFKPIGVYFAARDIASTAIPGNSIVNALPDGTGGPCGYPLGPDPASMQASDAGAGDAGQP